MDTTITLVLSCPRCENSFPDGTPYCPSDGARLVHELKGPEVIGGRYEIVAPISEGGMGTVFKAKHNRLGRLFAVKFLARELMAKQVAVQRFEREAQVASHLHHPNLVEVLDFGTTDDHQPYLVMELVQGTDLRSVIYQDGPLDIERLCRVMFEVGAALDYAHSHNVVHRDLKSANIMLVHPDEGTELVKIVDFGISKHVDLNEPSVTRTGAVVGTPEYMSPEQIAGKTVDGRSDIYSMGIVIYEALTGSLPFQGTTGAILSAHIATPPPALRDHREELPQAVEDVVLRALAKDPDHRYATASELAEALIGACGHQENGTMPLGSHSLGREGLGSAILSRARTAALASSGGARRPRARQSWYANPTYLALGFALVATATSVVLGFKLWNQATGDIVAAGPETSKRPPLAAAKGLPTARELIRKKRFKEARRLLLRVTETAASCRRAPLLAAAGAAEHAVTDAERCIDLDPNNGSSVEIAEAVVQGLGTGARNRAYKLLVGELSAAARNPILKAAKDPNALVRAGAFKVAKKLGYASGFDEVSKLLLDLKDAEKCSKRRRLILTIADRHDKRALSHLEEQLSRPKRDIECFDQRVFAAIRALRKTARPR